MRRLLLLLALLWPLGAAAQTAALVADRLGIEADATLIAEGRVEILYQDTRLQAARLVFDQNANRLIIDGPITLTEGDRVIILANQAELSSDLQDGILRSARLVLDRQLQLAANRIDRVGGRYTQLSNTVTSSCQICPSNPTPTWEIRAKRVIHDDIERQIYFDQAVFRLAGVPIIYIPRLRLPDPSRKRATGLLIPSIRTTSQLNTGIKLPYFITLGRHADITLTPYLSPKTRTLELDYRHELRFGRLAVEAAITDDDLLGRSRYYVFANGTFQLPADFRLTVDAELVSDEAYLLDYGYSDKDRLTSELRLSRVRRDELIRGSLYVFETLRDNELPIADQLPGQYALAQYERRLQVAGGELRYGFDGAALVRESQADGLGRDSERIGVRASWRRTGISQDGIVATAEAGLSGYAYNVREDSTYGNTGQVTTGAAVTLRWPFQKTAADGASLLFEPIVQLAYTDTKGAGVPNEDSTLVEFDEGNLFALNRFPGSDAVEQGLRANLGFGFTRVDADGWSLALTMGRVVRLDDQSQFAAGTGLDGTSSDWLAAMQLRIGDRMELAHRMLFDDRFDVTKAESRLAYQNARALLAGTYLYMTAEPAENRPTATNEVILDGAYRLTRHWTGRLDGRFDLLAERTASAGLGLIYRSECLSVDLSVSRRFTSSTSVSPSTAFGLQVNLAGFGSGGNPAAFRRTCEG